jgi:hypothetical protein
MVMMRGDTRVAANLFVCHIFAEFFCDPLKIAKANFAFFVIVKQPESLQDFFTTILLALKTKFVSRIVAFLSTYIS